MLVRKKFSHFVQQIEVQRFSLRIGHATLFEIQGPFEITLTVPFRPLSKLYDILMIQIPPLPSFTNSRK